MKVNAAKAKMLAGGTAFGFELGFGSPLVAEALSRTGIDYLQIDTQHGDWGPGSTLAALVAMEGGTATPMARVARNDYTQIGRLLDEGMMGIVVPMVHTADDAKAAADACRFPPLGTRSCGWGRIGRTDPDYWDWIDQQVLLMVQIESITAVENAEAILSTPGVDGCWTGPADLAYSMGIHPRDQKSDDRHARALERILEACANTGKIPGIAAMNPEDAADRAAQGWRFINAGADYQLLMDAAETGLGNVGLEWLPTSARVRTATY
ncbi:MAG TPA: aldolase/citrate lyase family protein [Thermomicrobiales bacterium]|jgi:4-hydroxy-2-oxoheptanedioate aldolase|nr:aldolase/citrate lyase family protein [Thermomicrobiales bacterium]